MKRINYVIIMLLIMMISVITSSLSAGLMADTSSSLDSCERAIIVSANIDTLVPMYSAPNAKSSIAFYYYDGTVVDVIDHSNASFIRVRIGNVLGFINRQNLLVYDYRPSTLPVSFVTDPNHKDAVPFYINYDDSEPIDYIEEGQIVRILGKYKNWAHVNMDGWLGYMPSASFSTLNYDYYSKNPGFFADGIKVSYNAMSFYLGDTFDTISEAAQQAGIDLVFINDFADVSVYMLNEYEYDKILGYDSLVGECMLCFSYDSILTSISTITMCSINDEITYGMSLYDVVEHIGTQGLERSHIIGKAEIITYEWIADGVVLDIIAEGFNLSRDDSKPFECFAVYLSSYRQPVTYLRLRRDW